MNLMTKEKRLEYEHKILKDWDFLLEGIEGEDLKLNTALVLQNSYEKTVEAGAIEDNWLENLNEDVELNEAPTKSSAVGTNVIPNVLFPVVRRVFPALIANKLVSVQPLQAPTGVIYYIDYTFSDTKGKITAGDEYSANPQQTSPAFATWYSSEKIGPATLTAGATGNTATVDLVSFFGSAAIATAASYKRIEVYPVAAGTSTNGYAQFLQIATADDTQTDASGTAVGSANVNTDTGVVYFNDATLTDGVDYTIFVVYDQESSSNLPEMEFSIRSTNVTTTERKLKVRWTKESEQDMRAYHKIDVESELVKVASMEMNYEIDREVIRFIGDIVTPELSFLHDWSNDASSTGNNTSGNYLDRHRALAQKMYQASAKIAQYNRQGPASWAVSSPQIAAVLNMLPDYKGEISGGTFSVFEAGTLGSGLKIFVDPNRHGNDATEILLGFKSTNSTYGAGVVYSPYTNWMSNTVQNPDNFDSVRGFFQRYALHKVDRGQWHYSKLTLTNLAV